MTDLVNFYSTWGSRYTETDGELQAFSLTLTHLHYRPKVWKHDQMYTKKDHSFIGMLCNKIHIIII